MSSAAWITARQAEREQRLYEFAAAGLMTAISASMGRALPDDENARDLVRLGRAIFAEIDNPTEPPAKPEAAEGAAPEDEGDLIDHLSRHGTLA